MSKYRVVCSSLNVREEPTTSARILGKLKRGRMVEPTDLSADEFWYFVKVIVDGESIQGWVHKDFLVPIEGEPETDDDPEWLKIAARESGVSEVPGPGDNPRILEYHRETSLGASDDSVAWCSSFANWCMKQAGIEGTNSAAARSWLTWGKKLDEPRNGCVVVLKRGANPAQGHVAFYVGDGTGNVRVLGGNQGNQVKISNYPKSMLLGYRWPN